jgi:hypothetical protein
VSNWEIGRKLRWAMGALGSIALFGLVASRTAAQGCAMCYQTAAASGAGGREALRHGILILLLPASSLFLGVLAFMYRRRNFSR